MWFIGSRIALVEFFGLSAPFAIMVTFPESFVKRRQIRLVSLYVIRFKTIAFVEINTNIDWEYLH